MSPTVDEITRQILVHEGGYVNDPDDPGGPTKHGVTIGTMRRLGLDLNKDGTVDVADVKLVTEDLAAQVFKRHYFYGPKIDQLPESVQAAVYDMYVNSGSNAIKILQSVLNDLGAGPLVEDGGIGPLTIKAAHKADREFPGTLNTRYGLARRDWYYNLAMRRPASRKYAVRTDGGKGGWILRAESFIEPIYWLTSLEHEKIVKSWERGATTSTAMPEAVVATAATGVAATTVALTGEIGIIPFILLALGVGALIFFIVKRKRIDAKDH